MGTQAQGGREGKGGEGRAAQGLVFIVHSLRFAEREIRGGRDGNRERDRQTDTDTETEREREGHRHRGEKG